MILINLTPHVLNIFGSEGAQIVLPPSGQVARVSVASVQADAFLVEEGGEIPVYASERGEIEGLPDPKPGTGYVVSGMVRDALSGRRDVYAPGNLRRNAEGQPIGCDGLRW